MACTEDSYPLSNINKMVDNYVGFKMLSFMDVCFRYNQILMHEGDRDKTTFMVERGNYRTTSCPLVWRMSVQSIIGWWIRCSRKRSTKYIAIYIKDMIVKHSKEEHHIKHLVGVFRWVWHNNTRLNPEKCTFRVIFSKFLWFYLIEALTTKKAIMKLNRMFTTLICFISSSAQHALSF